ncbi:putative quinol monooxygenase [Agrococcus sp. Marseille-P2731]|uniref:putative quinol monooxygenase n=1 Tax=Agrococcus sp. Marseille-P2731 TaxID=1841862 RepID=UPI000930B87C|nr:antibiotic biosynthesis monooxygenase [Agrococcus sp. Marseille-P2731]
MSTETVQTTDTTDQPLVVTACFHPADGARDRVLAAMERVIPRVHEEAGCNLYAIQEAEDGTIIMIEHWDSAALLDEHGAGAPVADFNAELEGLLAKPVEVTRYRPLPVGGRKGMVVA